MSEFVRRVHEAQNKIDSDAGFDPSHNEEGEYVRGTQVVRYADEAMYRATPLTEPGEPVTPRVTLVSMTANPLRVMAAASQLYKGDVVSNPDEIPVELARAAFHDMTKTTLQAPLEFIDLHFLIEGVTRAWVQQLTRQRTAVYVAESLRFSVRENVVWEVMMPPSVAGLKEDDPNRVIWQDTISRIGWAYNALVNNGIPAEDARGLLPLNIATRVHYKTNLRNLAQHSGMRLCSQAQQEWKIVWEEMIHAIWGYGPDSERWQQSAIISLFKPICYQTGQCGFHASSDRYCVIRDRVDAHHAKGEAPDTWSDINPLEPLQATAARRPQLWDLR